MMVILWRVIAKTVIPHEVGENVPVSQAGGVQ
ncbi:hypothetical protein W909_02425 [Dickeya zeae EC1]|nr:hypothetical protein W909_02425 [Dickeya zeae EC1]